MAGSLREGNRMPTATTTSRHEPLSRAPTDVFRHYVGDVVYGANDGLVTTLTVVSGVAGAELPVHVVLILGFVNLLADGFSMGASNFLSIRSTAAAEDRDRGVLEPLAHAGVTFAAFVAIGIVPLLSFLAGVPRGSEFLMSCLSTGAVLFAVGASRSLISARGWIRCGLEMLSVGAVASAVAYGAGLLLARWVR
jgi:VIT1/CCC1 family predicted Fe2+/Mn2+ transporter